MPAAIRFLDILRTLCRHEASQSVSAWAHTTTSARESVCRTPWRFGDDCPSRLLRQGAHSLHRAPY